MQGLHQLVSLSKETVENITERGRQLPHAGWFCLLFHLSDTLQKCQEAIKELICLPWVSFPQVERKMSRPGSDVSKLSLLEKEWRNEDEESIQDCD